MSNLLDPVNLFGYLGDALILAGIWIIGRKKTTGWYVGVIGCLVSVTYAAAISSVPIMLVDSIFILIYARNIHLWKKAGVQA